LSTTLLIGGTGQVGFELARSLAPLGTLIIPGRADLDLTQPDSISNVIRAIRPDVIVNVAGFTIVDEAEKKQAELAMTLNAQAPGIIAECSKSIGALLVHYSTTFVFDGNKPGPYTEEDDTSPVNTYGRTKLAGEQAITAAGGHSLILRANWVYSARRSNFALAILKAARGKPELTIVNDQTGSPTWARDYAAATATLLQNTARLREHPGIYHLCAESHCTRLQWAEKLIACAKVACGTDTGWAKLLPTTTAQYPHIAPRPLNTVTSTRKIFETFGVRMPAWEERVGPFLRTLQRVIPN
jgi:dTDP-4-dehydrorhamnose reductase